MGRFENESISWNANQPFYEHMKNQVWDKLADADRQMNESQGPVKLIALENLHAAVRHWYDMIKYYAEPEERAVIENLFNNIFELTNGTEFTTVEATPEKNFKIKKLILDIRSELWLLTAKNGMLPTKRDMSGADVWY